MASRPAEFTVLAPSRRPCCRLCRHIILYSALVIVAIANIVALVAFQLRQSAMDASRANAANFSAAFEAQVERVMDSVAGRMERVKRHIETEGEKFDVSEWTQIAPELSSQPIDAAVIGPDGRLRAGTLDRPPGRADFSAEDYFQVHRDNPDAGLFAGKPVPGRAPNQTAMQLTRRLEKHGGGFAGVLVFTLDPEFLISLHRSIDLGAHGIMALLGPDSIVRAAHWGASNASAPAEAPIAGALSLPGAPQAKRGTYVAQSPLDQGTRIFDWRNVPGYPFTVIVGLDKDECLAIPNRLALIILGLGGAAMLLSGALAAMVVREISNRVRYEVEVNSHAAGLKDANENLTIQHKALVKTTSELAWSAPSCKRRTRSSFRPSMNPKRRTAPSRPSWPI